MGRSTIRTKEQFINKVLGDVKSEEDVLIGYGKLEALTREDYTRFGNMLEVIECGFTLRAMGVDYSKTMEILRLDWSFYEDEVDKDEDVDLDVAYALWIMKLRGLYLIIGRVDIDVNDFM